MRRILFIVENLPSPFDRRVWQEATSLQRAGYQVSIICPTGKGFERKYEVLEGIHIYRHMLPVEGSGTIGYIVEYSAALLIEMFLAWKVFFTRGFDVIHACNPPDNIFVIGAIFKLFGRKYVFDHHDINPELYLVKFERKDLFYKLLIACERLTFMLADVSIATNNSYKSIAVQRGKMPPEKVFVVRTGPDTARIRKSLPVPEIRKGKQFLVGYVGVMGKQEGIDLLLQAVRDIVYELQRQDIHFGLVGGGTELESMKLYAAESGVAEYVTFTGRVPDEVLLDVLNTADVCVNPDIANEMNDKSTMIKIMEYMALGKPIVQFDMTEGRYSAMGASLYARRNDVTDFALKIVELIDDPEKRFRMGELGRNRVENELAWKYEEPKLLSAYRHVFSAT